MTETHDRQDRPQADRTAVLPDGKTYDFWEQECVYSRTLVVSGSDPEASDQNDGSEAHPLKTIQRAADLAEPGTRVRIRAGIYRECVHPRRGGTDPAHMISYEAYGDGEVVIRDDDVLRIGGVVLIELPPDTPMDGVTRFRFDGHEHVVSSVDRAGEVTVVTCSREV